MDHEFEIVFNAFKNDIYRLVYSYTKNRFDADDITQNVFIKLYNNFQSFDDREHIKKWLIVVAVNECKNHFSSAWKRKIFPLSEKEENIHIVDGTNNIVLEAVLNLPKKYRLVVHLYYYEGYKIKEIASILKEKETTIQTRLARARTILKEIIGGIEDE
jgi:RNA polymerase sigma factor, sigma-70 family